MEADAETVRLRVGAGGAVADVAFVAGMDFVAAVAYAATNSIRHRKTNSIHQIS